MNKRLISVLIFALVVSATASVILYRLISSQLANNAKLPANRLLVAAHNLDNGVLIKDGDIKVVDWGGPIPMGAIQKPEDAVGRGVVQQIYEGEPLLETRIAAKGAGAGLAATIPPGMRAVALRVNDIVGVAGFVTPGMKVDILIAGTPPKGNGGLGTLTKTLLQNVEVLSAGQNIQKDAEGKPISVGVVNMLVTPEQAEVLSLASNETRIQLVLRNPMDKEETHTRGTATAYLYDGKNGEPPVGPNRPRPVKAAPRRAAAPPPPPPPAPAKVKPEPPPPITVEVIHGSSRAQSKFAAGDKKNLHRRVNRNEVPHTYTRACRERAGDYSRPGSGARDDTSHGFPGSDGDGRQIRAGGFSQIIERIAVANGDLAEAVAINPREILINGKAAGETSMVVWQQGGNRLFFDLTVQRNESHIDAVRRQMATEMGGDNVTMDLEDDTVFLRGTVPNLTTARPRLDDRLDTGQNSQSSAGEHPGDGCPDSAESAVRGCGSFDRESIGDQFRHAGTGVGNTIGSVAAGTSRCDPPAPTGTLTLGTALNVFLFRPDLNLGAAIQALQAKNLLQILAEPNVLAINGHNASFLAGGEFPYPTLQGGGGGLGQVTIAFREFGVRHQLHSDGYAARDHPAERDAGSEFSRFRQWLGLSTASPSPA